MARIGRGGHGFSCNLVLGGGDCELLASGEQGNSIDEEGHWPLIEAGCVSSGTAVHADLLDSGGVAAATVDELDLSVASPLQPTD